MAGNANNIIVGAADVSVGGSDVGYTKGGVSVRYEPTFIEVRADQAVGVVKRARSEERLYVKTSLLEASLAQLRRAFMYPAANLTGGGSTLNLGYNSSCWVDQVAIVLVGKGPNCGTRTFTFPACVAFGTREYAMTREAEVAFEIEFEVLKDSNGRFGTIIDS